MPVPPRRLAAVATAALAGLTLAACSSTAEPGQSPAPSGQATTGGTAGGAVTVGLTYTPDIQFAPFYLAVEKGYYADAGVGVTLRHHGASEGLFTAVAGGQEDVVVAGGDEMLQARSQDIPLLDVATLYQEYPVALIVPADSDIDGPEDLAGRSVGIPGPYGETYFGLLALLADAGLSEDDLDVEHIGYTQQAALTAGHVDAVMGYTNNDAVQFARGGTEVRTIPVAGGDAPLVGIGLGVLDETAEERPEAVAGVVDATLRAVRDIVADPEQGLDAAARHVPDLDRPEQREAALATLEATIPLYGEPAAVGTQHAQVWEDMVAFMAGHGLLGGEVDAADAWTDEFLPAATN